MNGVSNEEKQKSNIIKTLAIIGFSAAVVLMVWVAVQIVQKAPSAFTSLASLASSVHGTKDDFTITSDKTVVNDGETVVLSWENKNTGTHTFAYECTEGVIISLNNELGTIINCDQVFTIGNTNSLTININSSEQRFIDIPYTIAFTAEDTNEVSMADTNRLTVVNATIPLSGLVAGVDSEETEDIAVTENEPEETAPETPSPTPTIPAPTYVATYVIPTSNPNGYTDLAMTYRGVGELDGENFVARAKIDTDTQGAIQFSVKNIGTKTSSDWTYEVKLPNGQTYVSPKQKVLKPNEEALLSLGFGISDTGTKKFKGKITTTNDTNAQNNSFDWSVVVTN